MEMDKNIHKVAKAQWKKWCEAARYVFNEMMNVDEVISYGAQSQAFANWLKFHEPSYREHLGKVKWNAAFNSACIVNAFRCECNVGACDFPAKKNTRSATRAAPRYFTLGQQRSHYDR